MVIMLKPPHLVDVPKGYLHTKIYKIQNLIQNLPETLHKIITKIFQMEIELGKLSL